MQVIQSCSDEKHPSASELFQVLISIAYDAKALIGFANVPARGQWGTQSAQIFLDSLKVAIQQAIARHDSHRGGANHADVAAP